MSVKAFDLVPVVERLSLTADKAPTQITCLESCGKNVYIGTSESFIIHFQVEEKQLPNGKVTYTSEKQGMKYLPLKKPITQLKAASALNRIMVLCDGVLMLLNMFDLEPASGGSKIRGVNVFCLNENPIDSDPFSVEICVAYKKKNVQILRVTEDKISVVKEMTTSETPITMSMDGAHVCIALYTQYKIVNYDTGVVQELFPFDIDSIRPIVTRISKEEFLLSAPSALGMFASPSGMSQRPPLQWSDNLVSVVYLHPYILALNDEFVTVHSILDQQQKQSIPFQGGLCLGEYDGRIFLSTGKDVYALAPIPMEKQIQALLADKRVNEALDLAKNARKTGLTKDKFLKMYQRIQQQAGFIEFSQQHFEEAHDLFKNGKLDARELITLYPHLIPVTSNFTRAMPPLHDMADINQIARGNQDVLKEFKRFLLSYLEEVRGTRDAVGCHAEIDTALVKLYAELLPTKLIGLIATENACDMNDCVEWLAKFQCFHAQALLYKFNGDLDKALGVWQKLTDGAIKDQAFPGIEFVVDFMSNLSDYQLIWKYIDWLLDKDENLGVKVFMNRPESEASSERMKPEVIVDYLTRFHSALITYLQYLVFQKNTQKEKFHTHLALLYLEEVLKLRENPNSSKLEVDQARTRLRQMLQNSTMYKIQLVLGKIRDTDMHAECAILYAKLEEHERALRLLVIKLRDFGAAENYCIVNSKDKDSAYRKRLFHILLSVYLDPANERKDSLVAPAVSLLNNNKADFDTVKVLQLIPKNWSIGLLSQFLTSSIRKSVNGSRTTRVERMLARGENLQAKAENMQMEKNVATIAEDMVCPACKQHFTDPEFARYPNGIIVHVHCARNKNICPVTGKLFSTSAKQTNSPTKT